MPSPNTVHRDDTLWFTLNPEREWRARKPLTDNERDQYGAPLPGGRRYALVRRGAGPGASWVSVISLPFDLTSPPRGVSPAQLDSLIARIVAEEQTAPDGETFEFDVGRSVPGWGKL